MTTTTAKSASLDTDFWAALTAPFPQDQIELLPKPFAKDSPKAQCNRPDRNGLSCDGFHGMPAVHLSYVGHAGITTRLNEVCTPAGWSWEPFTLNGQGLPGIDGGLWIRLSITTPSGVQVSKIGFGDAPGKSNATKELIGDALRNAAMRFGVGTYLWSKSDSAKATLERGDADTQTAAPEQAQEPAQARPAARGTGQKAQDRPEHQQAFYAALARLDALDTADLRARWAGTGLPNPDLLDAEQVETAQMLIVAVQTDRANREQAAQGTGPTDPTFP